jgi:hypothetical protein
MTWSMVDKAYAQLAFVCFVFVILGYYLNNRFGEFYNFYALYIIAWLIFSVGSFITFVVYPMWVKKE